MKLYHNPNTRPSHPDEDGGIDMVFFTGPHAEERARQYSEWLAERLAEGAVPC